MRNRPNIQKSAGLTKLGLEELPSTNRQRTSSRKSEARITSFGRILYLGKKEDMAGEEIEGIVKNGLREGKGNRQNQLARRGASGGYWET